MRAAVYTRYGSADAVEVREANKPTPADDQVLIRVRAASVNPLDYRMLKGVPLFVRLLFRLSKPTSKNPQGLGRDVAGVVEAVGKNVTSLRPGDEVFGVSRNAFAEYTAASPDKIIKKPPRISFEDAAAIPVAGLSALQALRDKGHVGAGTRVLINGASGGVGTFAVQMAKWLGADVTGVCSTRNLDLVRSLGADRVIDYTSEDFTNAGVQWDAIIDCAGGYSLPAIRRALKAGGHLVIVGGPASSALTLGVRGKMSTLKTTMLIGKITVEDLAIVAGLVESGTVKPVIDRRYALSDARDAMAYVMEGHARGKVIVTV